MTADGDTLDLTIQETAYRGAGVARADGWVVFVPGAWPAERVRVAIARRRKQYGEGRLLEVLAASPQRVAPACPLAGTCPGCAYQALDYAEEVRQKQAQLARFLTRQAGLAAAALHPPLASPQALGYRNKLVLHAARAADTGRIDLGYVGADNATVLDVATCPLARPELQAHLAALRADAVFRQALRDGETLTLRGTEPDGVQHWLGKPAPAAPWLRERVAGLGDLWVPRGGFFQVNPAAAALLLDVVRDWVRDVAPAAVADLYCGVGVFALMAAQAGVPAVAGLDLDAAGIRAAQRNAADRGLAHVRFAAGPADRLARATLARHPAARTLLIVDPPRAGLAQGLIADILRAAPAHMIYVSCAADTLARDLAALTAGGYRIAAAQLVDMFPRTAYFETAVRLVR